MEGLNRRDFLKVGAVATTATAAACTYDYKVPQENVLPLVVNPEDVQPGLANYYATVCHGCASACGLVARNKDGRVVGVEGNPDHQGGGLCTRGHFDLVAAYGPDRVEGPMDARNALSWDDATKKVNDAVAAARAAGKAVAWLGAYRSGSASALLDELALAGVRRLHWEPLGVDSLLAAARQAFGVDELPVYELADARTIVTFGYDFLNTAFGSMAMAKGWAKAKDPAHGEFVTRLVAFEARLGTSSSGADHWFAAAPGSEAKVAFALAKLCAEAKGYAGPAAAMLASVDVAAAAAAAGLDEARLKQTAEWLAAGSSVVLPGGPTTQGADASALALATLLCNEVLGNIGKSVTFGRGARPGQVNTFAEVKALVEDAAAGKVGVLFLDGLDLAHLAPAELAVADALAKVDLLVQLANEPDDTSSDKTLLLPTGSGFEHWSDAQTERGVAVLGQQAMVPLKDSRGLGDVLLALVKANPAPAAPVAAEAAPVDPAAAPVVVASTASLAASAATFADFVKARWVGQLKPADASADAWWRGVQATGVFSAPTAVAAVTWQAGTLPELAAGLAAGEQALLLHPGHLADGRWANVPWAQELPDPITSTFWNSWVEINPKTAEALGLSDKDEVKLTTDKGSLVVGWFGSPAVREGAFSLVMGNGKKVGRYAKGRGVNAASLLGATTDAAGALVLSGIKVTAARSNGGSTLHELCGSKHQDGRPIAVAVNVEDAIKNLKGEPASIVPLHHLPIDERVTAAGSVDMFPEPKHPTYRFALTIDNNVCNGCGACQIACALENNTPFIGPAQLTRGRTMVWIRMDRFFEGEGENPDIRYLPALCQQCSHAPCEGVCPVLATYHNLDGLNAMIYNRCVGTRYCANNCPYTARRFNYHTWQWPESYHMMLNPDLSTREMGVMEKCTFCVQRTRSAKDQYRDMAFDVREPGKPVNIGEHLVPDAALRKLTACAAACPTEAITFGNWNDESSTVRAIGESPRAYTLLGELNTKPGVRYVARINHNQPANAGHHGGGHGGGHEGGGHDAGGHEGGGHGAGGHEAAPAAEPAHGAEHKEG